MLIASYQCGGGYVIRIGVTSCGLLLQVAVAAFACGHLFAQPLALNERSAKNSGNALAEASTHVIRADVNMVLVPAVVTDRKGATVNGLSRESFAVLEDKVPQAIVSLSN